MSVTPQITLTATLQDFSGTAIGSVANPAYLRISLCGFGQVLPSVPGTATIGDVASWPGDIPYLGAQITQKLWGNDVITPGPNVTYYCIAVLDQNKNVLQSACYRFSGTETVDLSSLIPIIPVPVPPVPPPPIPVLGLQYVTCTPAGAQVAGTLFTAPIGSVVMVFWNGTAQRSPEDFTLVNASQFMLNFDTGPADIVSALVAVLPVQTLPLTYGPCTPDAPQPSGTEYTAAGKVVMVFYNGTAQSDYTLTAPNKFTLDFATFNGDLVYALTTT